MESAGSTWWRIGSWGPRCGREQVPGALGAVETRFVEPIKVCLRPGSWGSGCGGDQVPEPHLTKVWTTDQVPGAQGVVETRFSTTPDQGVVETRFLGLRVWWRLGSWGSRCGGDQVHGAQGVVENW